MTYYKSETCWNGDTSGCTTDYEASQIKYVIDAWKNAKASTAIEARLITVDEVTKLGYEWKQTCPTCGEGWVTTNVVPTWVYNSNHPYWTSSQYNDDSSRVWAVRDEGELFDGVIYNRDSFVVRPVIVLPKSVL